MNTTTYKLYHALPFLRKLNIMRVQFLLRLDRERKSPFTVEAVDVPCALCGNDTDFTVIFRPFLISKLKVVRCNACGLRFQRPMPTSRFYEWMYNHKYLDRVSRRVSGDADDHTRQSYATYDGHADEILRFMEPHLPPRRPLGFLEVGPAHACNLEVFRRIDDAAVLYEDELDRRWEPRYQEKGILNWRQQPAGTTVDVVILSAILEHFRDPVVELGRMHEALADDGVIYVEVPNVPEDLEYFSGYKLGHTHYFSERSLRDTLEHVGFHPLDVQAGRKRLKAVCRK